jgi:hypothetical protein
MAAPREAISMAKWGYGPGGFKWRFWGPGSESASHKRDRDEKERQKKAERENREGGE